MTYASGSSAKDRFGKITGARAAFVSGTRLLPLALFLLLLSDCSSTGTITTLFSGEPVVDNSVWFFTSTNCKDAAQADFIPSTCYATALKSHLLPTDSRSVALGASSVPANGACPKSVSQEPQVKEIKPDDINPEEIKQCVYAMMNVIDRRYDYWADSLRGTTALGNTIVDTSVIGIGAAGALTTGFAPQVLSGVASFLTGTKSSVNNDVFINNSIQTILTQMDEDRASIASVIAARLNVTSSQNVTPSQSSQKKAIPQKSGAKQTGSSATQQATAYKTLAEAWYDLQRYSRAGSYTNAYTSLQAQTGAQASACKADLKNTKAGTKTEVTASTATNKCPQNQSSQ